MKTLPVYVMGSHVISVARGSCPPFRPDKVCRYIQYICRYIELVCHGFHLLFNYKIKKLLKAPAEVKYRKDVQYKTLVRNSVLFLMDDR